MPSTFLSSTSSSKSPDKQYTYEPELTIVPARSTASHPSTTIPKYDQFFSPFSHVYSSYGTSENHPYVGQRITSDLAETINLRKIEEEYFGVKRKQKFENIAKKPYINDDKVLSRVGSSPSESTTNDKSIYILLAPALQADTALGKQDYQVVLGDDSSDHNRFGESVQDQKVQETSMRHHNTKIQLQQFLGLRSELDTDSELYSEEDSEHESDLEQDDTRCMDLILLRDILQTEFQRIPEAKDFNSKHYLFLVKDSMIFHVLKKFWSWYKFSHTSSVTTCAGSPYTPSSFSLQKTDFIGESSTGVSCKGKRKLGAGFDGKDESRPKRATEGVSKGKCTKAKRQGFACPFRKHNPTKYGIVDWPFCSMTSYPTISRLKLVSISIWTQS